MLVCQLEEPKDGGSIAKITVGIYTEREADFWDNGYGPVWVYRDSMGVVGFARAETWEKAYECIVDEIMPDAPPYEEWDADEKAAFDKEDGTLPEGYTYRGGMPANKKLTQLIAQEDLNGFDLSRLEQRHADEYNIKVYWEGQ